MPINQLIAQGGTNIKSPIQRYREEKQMMQGEQQNRLAMEAQRQTMGYQQQQQQRESQKFEMAKAESFGKSVAPLIENVMKSDNPEEAYRQQLPIMQQIAEEHNIPANKISRELDRNQATSFISRFGTQQYETKTIDGVPVQVAKTGEEKASPRAKKMVDGQFAKIDPSKYTPKSIDAFTQSGKYSDLVAKPKELLGGLSAGETAVDRAFAKDYVAWTTGGYADVEKNLSQLKDVQLRLESGKENLTGPVIGKVPDPIRAITNPGSIEARDEVQEVVQRNLRLILGGQFAKQEGEQLIARAYNESLDEAVNAKRVGRLVKAIEDAALAKQAATDYYNQNGTLKGFKGKQFTLADIAKAIETEPAEVNGAKTINTQAEYDKLPSGAEYIDPEDGKRYRKQ